MPYRAINKDIAYSIRKCNDDEIEIRLSLLDGYIRGFIRFLIVGMFFIGANFDTSRGITPFSMEMDSIKENVTWAFEPDILIKKQYEEYVQLSSRPVVFETFPNHRVLSYAEYKNDEAFTNAMFWGKIKTACYIIFTLIITFLVFLPRINGIRVNRKKRVIYWKFLDTQYEIAYVPEQGNPLAGLVYDKFGLYAFGWGKYFSLRFDILTQGEKEPAHHFAGVYPTVSLEHNDHILLAIQSYLTEENPPFLKYLGRRFKTFGDPFIMFCNAITLPCCFSNKKAQAALDMALKKWHKKKPTQKQGWFTLIQSYQKYVNKQLDEQELDNQIK